jgi:hypothetical protein
MVEKVTESFLNWGFNPSVSTQGFNNPPYVGALVKFWYRNTEEGAEFTIYYIFNFRAITNTKLFNKCKKLLESVEEGKQQQKWNKANYLITRLVALAIANEWGYDDFDDIEGPLVNDERYTTLRFDIYENEFNWRGIHPINTPFFDFLRYDVQMFDISEGMEIALNYAEMIPGWAELDEGA